MSAPSGPRVRASVEPTFTMRTAGHLMMTQMWRLRCFSVVSMLPLVLFLPRFPHVRGQYATLLSYIACVIADDLVNCIAYIKLAACYVLTLSRLNTTNTSSKLCKWVHMLEIVFLSHLNYNYLNMSRVNKDMFSATTVLFESRQFLTDDRLCLVCLDICQGFRRFRISYAQTAADTKADKSSFLITESLWMSSQTNQSWF